MHAYFVSGTLASLMTIGWHQRILPGALSPTSVNVISTTSGTVALEEVALIRPASPTSRGQPLRSQCMTAFAYPAAALRARMQGRVVLVGSLSAGGHVEHVWIVVGINPLLNEAAMNGLVGAFFPLPNVPDSSERLFTAIVAFTPQ